MKKISYLLYDNQEQDNLLAMANDEKELKEVSKEFPNGCWFEYDEYEGKYNKDYGQSSPTLHNERLYKKGVKFDGSIKRELVSDFDETPWLVNDGTDLRS